MRAQVWYSDFIIAIVIFGLVIALVYKFMPNVRDQDLDSIEAAYNDAKDISGTLLTEGYPEYWNEEDVISIGITKADHALDKRKADMLGNLSELDYYKAKARLGIRSDFLIYFEDASGLRKVGDRYVIGHSAASVSTDAIGKSIGYYAPPASMMQAEMTRISARTGAAAVQYATAAQLALNLGLHDTVFIQDAQFNDAQVLLLDAYVQAGGAAFLTDNARQDAGDILNATFTPGASPGTAIAIRNDRYLDLEPGDEIMMPLNSTLSGPVQTIANSSQGHIVARWRYGSGLAYYFSSVNSSTATGNFSDYVGEAIEQYMEDEVINASLDLTAIFSDDTARISRVLIYDREPIVMVVLAWH